jgi:polysaccharide pyruvyl transferase WcaK-like protein/nitrite reductase/ring-hydroxylating ferredoxin subunit
MHLHIGHMFFGAGNIGDDLVLAGFLEGIGELKPDKITCATSFDIEAQRRRFPQIEWSIHDRSTRERLIAGCDAWIGLGGPVLQETDDHWLLKDQLDQLEECRRQSKPAFFFCCSVDHRADMQRPDIRFLLAQASWIWTRDALSTRALTGAGFDRVTTAADLSHLVLRKLQQAPMRPDTTGFVCNFERPADYSIDSISNLIAASARAAASVGWLVQETRTLPGSELDIYRRLPDRAKAQVELRRPDYQAASVAGLVDSWGHPARFLSTRYHGAIIGAWSGSRVVVFERQQKLRGLAETLGFTCFTTMPDPDNLARAFALAKPVQRAVLESTVRQAEHACGSLLDAVAEAMATSLRSRKRVGNAMSIDGPLQARVEHHSLTGITMVEPEQIGPGLERGEMFVVRGCLQAIGAFQPLRSMILDTLEEVAGAAARTRAEAEGLTELHAYVSIDQLMRMNPLMKQRARLLAPDIVANLAMLLPGLGPDIHFEDTPNARIFVPQDTSAKHEEELQAYVERRGSGGELTLHPPHQDNRHFHPIGAINIWCAIDRVTESNGMSVFPEFYGHHLPFTQADGGIRPDQFLGPPVTTDLAPGDAWIFETIHVHGSTINQTDQTRVVISFRVTPHAPKYRDRPWYNYVRPADCTADGPPASKLGGGQSLPHRGKVTIDTSGMLPPLLVSSQSATGETRMASELVREGEIRPISDRICIARIDGKPVAFARRCPDQGADLAGGAIRNRQIVCAWHGLRLDAADGSSACRTIPSLGLVRSTELAGVIAISRVPATDQFAPLVLIDQHAEATRHFILLANRFHEALETYCQSQGRSGLAELRGARNAAAYALLGLPGNVIKSRFEAEASRLISEILRSGVRRIARTSEEEDAFIECWRRLGESWNDDATFAYGLPALALSNHGLELLSIAPLMQDLGWTEPLWLLCLLETLPANVRLAGTALCSETLPRSVQEVQSRISRLEPAARDELFRAFSGAIAFDQETAERGSHADQSSLHQQIETLTRYLAEANADREVSHQNIHILTAHLKEANADREISHQNIHTLTAHLKEANADRAISHKNILTLTEHLRAAQQLRGGASVALAKLARGVRRLFPKG